MIYKIIIPARANSKRLPGKNVKLLAGKPLIEYSIEYALNNFSPNEVWINSNDLKVIELARNKGVNILERPEHLAKDNTPTIEVLKYQINHFKKKNIKCDALILLQPTNPLRSVNLLREAISQFELSGRNSLASFSTNERKIGIIKNNFFEPSNYMPGQRSQDLERQVYENGLIYITKIESILKNEIITKDVYPYVCDNINSKVDIDYIEDFIFAETILKSKNEEK